MPKGKKRPLPEVSSGSMADIAFLLLIFFLVTTTIPTDKGIILQLPPKVDEDTPPPQVDKNDRNVFAILANSKDDLLVEDEIYDGSMTDLKNDVKKFILNFGKPGRAGQELYQTLPATMKSFISANGRDPDSSDDPNELVVSFKANRGTSYELYIKVLDAVNAAYNEVYAERAGITVEEWLSLDKKDPAMQALYDQAREGIPRAVSIAEPDK